MAFDLDDDELRATRKMKKLDNKELTVGEYVRTKDGIIAQVKSIDYEDGIYRFDKDVYINDFGVVSTIIYNNEMLQEMIVKHSAQLIYLIENKDILKVKDSDSREVYFIGVDEDTSDIKYEKILEDIKSDEFELIEIVTHEQFDANSYKVEGE